MPDYISGLLRRPPVGWWDLLDIAIVSIVIYEALKLIKGTRAVQMAVGSLFIIGSETKTWASPTMKSACRTLPSGASIFPSTFAPKAFL